VGDDGVDILVDLSGHTGGNRLRAFARRLAPLQLCGHGYPATTGLESFDWRLTDALNDPPGVDAYYTERLYRLPGFCCSYRPASDAPLPRQPGGVFTFGSLNNVRKITPRMVALWARILQRVPSARLLIAGTPPGAARERISAGLGSAGVALQRVDFESWLQRAEYAALHGRIDVALDTYPYNGSTTTFEALWHGLPLVTLSGPTLVSRLGRGALEALGESRFWADNDEDYVAVAVELADRAEELPALRRSLHDRMRASTILDERGYVARVEDAYRDMWRQWCSRAA
jgi:predicted O-linked N-acetylglucosamine transferase (SPINDLY family)